MKAWLSRGQGVDDLRLEAVEVPTPGAGCALLQVHHAALNFSDLLMIQDKYQIRPPRPFIPGQEVAGIVVEAGPDSISVAIEDNGVGLPKDRERIVEPYVTTRERGTGLGLAIVNKIVEEHGGDMQFSVRPEGGTRVTLRFARDPDRAHDAPQDGDEQNSDKR